MAEESKTLDSLQGYFLQVVRQSFWQVGLYDATVTEYIAQVLVDFAITDNLYKLRDRGGRKIDSVVELLAQAPAVPVDEADVLRQRRLRKYVGDYALFMSGVFRTYIDGKGSWIFTFKRAAVPIGRCPTRSRVIPGRLLSVSRTFD